MPQFYAIFAKKYFSDFFVGPPAPVSYAYPIPTTLEFDLAVAVASVPNRFELLAAGGSSGYWELNEQSLHNDDEMPSNTSRPCRVFTSTGTKYY